MFWPSNNKRKKPLATPSTSDNNIEDGNDEEEYEYHDCDYYDEVFDSIVKIYATHNFEPDTTMPWQSTVGLATGAWLGAAARAAIVFPSARNSCYTS